MAGFHIYPLNEKAISIDFGGDISLDTHQVIMATDEKLKAKNFAGFIETVPAYKTLTIYYEPVQVIGNPALAGENAFDKIKSFLIELLAEPIDISQIINQPLVTIPVCYDISMGPDLEIVASYTQKTIPDIIDIHTHTIYTVFMMGFSPGFPYLGVLPKELEISRKDVPRVVIPAGSVAIAGRQTGIYPFDTPGGWHIIGRTPLRLFDTGIEELTLLKPGFKVKFKPISLVEYETIKAL